jgi:NAD(P)-dependent dehydrogenase (short-subunit alcohol dehydrogenase family)
MWTTDYIPDQTGKTIIVTGANAGIGYETAKALYQKGADVVIAARDAHKADAAIREIISLGGSGSLAFIELNLASLAAVKKFAAEFKHKRHKLDVLINNAGVMTPPASKTDEGYELQFGVNHIGHFALTGHLYPLLNATAGSRVVTVSSNTYLRGTINFNNLCIENDYDPAREYAQSKLANMLFSLELQRRIEAAGNGVQSIAVQPGVNKTELSRHMSKEAYAALVERIGELMEPWQGALPLLYGATSPNARGGKYYCPDQDGGYRGYPAESEVIPAGKDVQTAKKLWGYSEKATGVVFP